MKEVIEFVIGEPLAKIVVKKFVTHNNHL